MHPLDWRSRESIQAKSRLLDRWTDGVPPVIWYDLLSHFSDGVLPAHLVSDIIHRCHPRWPAAARITTRRSQHLPGHFLLKVERPEAYPYFLELDGCEFPLYQAGGETEALTGITELAVNFAMLWPSP